MTLPDNVLYVSQSASKTGANFAPDGRDLTWSGINLAKKGSTLRVRLKLNTTSCVDGQLAFAAATSVVDCPATASKTALARVKHQRGWTPCLTPAPTPAPPTEVCSVPAQFNSFACPSEVNVCGTGSEVGTGNIFSTVACAQACNSQGAIYGKFIAVGPPGQCVCFTTVDGYSTNSLVASFAVGQPRTPPNVNTCG